MKRYTLLALAALTLLGGCTRYQFLSPYQKDEIEDADRVIVKTTSSSPHCCRQELTNVKIGDRTLTGYDPMEKKIEIALTSIESIMVAHTDSRAVWYVLAAVASAGAVAGSVVVLNKLHREAEDAPPPPEGESCPFFYSFDGRRYVFEVEMFEGSITAGLERTDWSRLEHLVESGGRYRMRVTNELQETQYINEIKLVVVDHPASTVVVPDIRGRIHTISRPEPPLKARDREGSDIRARLASRDGIQWKTSGRDKDPRDELVLEFPKPSAAKKAKLLVGCNATHWAAQVAREFLRPYGNKLADWYAEVDRGGPAHQKVLDWYHREELYVLQVNVQTDRGWKEREVILGGGPFATKEKAYPLDLDGVEGDKLVIKLRPPAHFWKLDYLAVDYSEDLPVTITELSAVEAYDHEGEDVRRLLAKNDDKYLVMPDIGDSIDLVFTAPPGKKGMQRSVVLKAGGYYKVHLKPGGEYQSTLIDRLNNEPGFTIRYALEKRRELGVRLKQARGENR